jgi:hypothetical protein
MVEGDDMLDEVHVAGVGNPPELRAGYQAVKLVGGRRRHQNVLGARGDQGGDAKIGQARACVMTANRLGLAAEAHEAGLERVVDRSLYPRLDEIRVVGEGLAAEQPGQGEMGELLRIVPRLHAQEVVDHEAAVAVYSGGRAV